MHRGRGRSIAQCLHDRTAYAMNPAKTRGGELVTAYQCNPAIVDAEFAFSKRQYRAFTGRTQDSDVIAYQVRQSFRPGEISPEEANRIGYEFAMRFLKGKHAFIVSTHIDKRHIHNHIIWNSTALDCKRKFRDFRRSAQAVRALSDVICVEHGLSIIREPGRRGQSYNVWLGGKKKPSHREILRLAIDDALAKKPNSFDELLRLLSEDGYEIKRRDGEISLRGREGKGFLRLSSLGAPYAKNALTAVIAGGQKQRQKRRRKAEDEPSLLVDIEQKLREGKGVGYMRWASGFNLKQMAKTLSYLSSHKLLAYSDLAAAAETAKTRHAALLKTVRDAERRMAEISELRRQIINYRNTRDEYIGYRKAGYSKKYLQNHETEILLHKAAKKAFDELGLEKLPSVKSLNAEYDELMEKRKRAYAEYRAAKEEMRALQIHKANVDTLLGTEESYERQNERKPR